MIVVIEEKMHYSLSAAYCSSSGLLIKALKIYAVHIVPLFWVLPVIGKNFTRKSVVQSTRINVTVIVVRRILTIVAFLRVFHIVVLNILGSDNGKPRNTQTYHI